MLTIDEALRAIAGTFVLLALLLGWLVSPYWFLFAAFVGLNLLQSAFTRWCPMMSVLRKLGLPQTRVTGATTPPGSAGAR